MEEGYTKARLDKRRIVNYKDMGGGSSPITHLQKLMRTWEAAVVARSEEFDFLRGVWVPTPPTPSFSHRFEPRMSTEYHVRLGRRLRVRDR